MFGKVACVFSILSLIAAAEAGAEPQSDAKLDQASGILGFYLARIRADGVAKPAPMKQWLDKLAENNSAILALINAYSPHASHTEVAPPQPGRRRTPDSKLAAGWITQGTG